MLLKCSIWKSTWKSCTSVAILTQCGISLILNALGNCVHDDYQSVLYLSIIVTLFFQEVLEGQGGALFPAARVVPTNGELFWLVDDPAAASLTIQVERLNSGAKL